jgi:uncharacterized protein YjbI with pentapeptide repeats
LDAAKTADLPEFEKKAYDLEAIKKVVDDAASVGGGLWLSYLFVLFYLAIAAGAVTHADLFLENPVKLPFLNVELPLLAFFFLAPILFLFVHAYTLVHLVFLTDKAKRFDQALSTQIGDDSGAAKDADDPRIAAIAGVRGQLPSNIFIQFLAGPRDRRAGSFGWLLRLIAWSTLAVAPILLLLLFQLQFLPFHNSWITWTHRLALVADLVLIWWLWRKILSGRDAVTSRPLAVWVWRGIGALLTVCTFLFSWGLATFPGEWQEGHLPEWRVFPARELSGKPYKESLHDWVFNTQVDATTRRRWLPFSSTLVLTGFNIYEGLNIDDPEKAKWRDFVFRARGRDLKGAIFDFASLPKVDFEGAQFQDASLSEAHLEGSTLEHAQLQVAYLSSAHLQGVSLRNAQLQGAWLAFAQLQGASLIGAELQGASLDVAQLQGASLDVAQLQGASLKWAQLQGASLDSAKLQGASLEQAQLQGASLSGADLLAANLSGALLWRSGSGSGADVAAISLADSPDLWRPIWKDPVGQVQPWNDKAYQDLRKMMESLPAAVLPQDALERIRRLDCANPDPTLAPCDPSLPPPPEAAAWLKALEDARVDNTAHAKALAKVLKTLLCSGNDNAEYVLDGGVLMVVHLPVGNITGLLADVGPEAPALVDFIMSKDCPLFTSLTDEDKTFLLRIKEQATAKPGG